MPSNDLSKPIRGSLRRLGFLVIVVIGLLAGGVIYWAQQASIHGAVIASGQFVVETTTKRIQHSEGGYVQEISVRDGSVVAAGDQLVRLDDTQVRASLEITSAQLNEAIVTEARLLAEQAGLSTFDIPEADLSLTERDEKLERVMTGQQRLLAARQESIAGQIRQLREQIAQYDELAAGLEVQKEAKTKELDLVSKEVVSKIELLKKGLTTKDRLTPLQRDETRLDGERGRLIAEIARTKQGIAEKRVQIIRVEDDARAENLRQLQEIRLQKARLIQEKAALNDRLRRLVIRAPQDGVVHKLAIHTIGGVVSPSEVIMFLVPGKDHLVIEAQLNPQDIDQVYPGQKAILRLSSFNQRNTPELEGEVISVSPDTAVNPVDNRPYYTLRVAAQPGELDRLGDKTVVPGMPVEAFMRTSERTVMAYLLQPLTDQISRTFRED